MKFQEFARNRLRNVSIIRKDKKRERINCIYCMDTGKSKELDFMGQPCKRCKTTTKEGSQKDG